MANLTGYIKHIIYLDHILYFNCFHMIHHHASVEQTIRYDEGGIV